MVSVYTMISDADNMLGLKNLHFIFHDFFYLYYYGMTLDFEFLSSN